MKILPVIARAVLGFVLSAGLSLRAQSGQPTPASHEAKQPSKDSPTARVQSVTSAGDNRLASDPGKPSPASTDFARIDTDRDGRISPVEYASSVNAAIDAVADGRRRGTKNFSAGFSLRGNEGLEHSKEFRDLDMDGNGFLTPSEWNVSRQPSPGSSKH
jgi:hypothetical protein